MAKAIGIGGVFLHFKGEEKELFEWYEKNLGMSFSNYGSGFIEGEQLVLLSFKRGDKPDTPYLNLRVDDIVSLIKRFKEQDLTIITDVTTYDYGKFATFIDPFGNPIELWEPDVLHYKKLVKQELKDYKKHQKPLD